MAPFVVSQALFIKNNRIEWQTVADVYLILWFFESRVYNYKKKQNVKVNFNIIPEQFTVKAHTVLFEGEGEGEEGEGKKKWGTTLLFQSTFTFTFKTKL